MTLKELKSIFISNGYTLKVNTGCDYMIFSHIDMAKDNELYHAYDDSIVSEILTHDDGTATITVDLVFTDENGDSVNAVTGEKVGVKNEYC